MRCYYRNGLRKANNLVRALKKLGYKAHVAGLVCLAERQYVVHAILDSLTRSTFK
jgi:hypothetical protein